MKTEQIEPQAEETRESIVYQDMRTRIGDMLAEKARGIPDPDESGFSELLRRANLMVGELEEWIDEGNKFDDLTQVLPNGFLTYASVIGEDPIAATLIADENPLLESILGPSYYRTHWNGIYIADTTEFMDQYEVRHLTLVGTNHIPADFPKELTQ